MADTIRPPIFVFWDDLLTFDSVEAAELYLEPWCCEEELTVYDAEGQLLQISLGNPRRGGVRIAAAETIADKGQLLERLCSRLVGIAKVRPDLVAMAWVEQATPNELIEWCWQHRIR
jgi:hypothetical protein